MGGELMTAAPIKGFFAYPSNPPNSSDAIKEAVEQLNINQEVKIKTWEELTIVGKRIISEICNEIDSSQLFLADITGINPNVLFELGYAIAKNKRIWLILDTSILNSKTLFDQFSTLISFGYAPYQNSGHIIRRFYEEIPQHDLASTLFESEIRPQLVDVVDMQLLYLKSKYENEASIKVANQLRNLRSSMIIDDPREAGGQNISWYAQQISRSTGVLCHFLQRQDSQVHNARNSLICGLAHGMGKNIVILAENEFPSPLDYKHLVRKYERSSDAVKHMERWLPTLEQQHRKERDAHKRIASVAKLATELKSFRIGEYLAENEEDYLDECFIETQEYREALEGRSRIFVGRKGCGKTANLLKLTSMLRRDPHNLVCSIRPVAYEVEGVLNLLKRYKDFDNKGFVIESLWKFLLYTELAACLAREIEQYPAHVSQSKEQTQLLEILLEEKINTMDDFSIRLERYVGEMLAIRHSDSIEAARHWLTEQLHKGILGKLRPILRKLLSERPKVAVLIDNLDKAWDRRSDLDSLAHVLLGLLAAAGRLPDELIDSNSKHTKADFSLALFLRADIFHRVMKVARERDKIVYSQMKWNNSELLLRVVEERMSASVDKPYSSHELWSHFMCERVGKLETKNFILAQIIQRPRDLLFFVKAALAHAVNCRHERIQEGDLLVAEAQYSKFAIDSILVEDNQTSGKLESLLYEFAGMNAILTTKEVKNCLQRNKFDDSEQENIIDLLCTLSFLGPQVGKDEFRYVDDPQTYQITAALARNFAKSSKKDPRYRIHNAFHTFLELDCDCDSHQLRRITSART